MIRTRGNENLTMPERPSERQRGERFLTAANQGGEASERHPRELARKAGNKAIEAAAITSIQMRMEDFRGVYPAGKIRRDEKYVIRHERFFEKYEGLAQDFEDLFIRGIQVGHWLGNTQQRRTEIETDDSKGLDFTTATFKTAPYDDYSHRVDVFSLLSFQEKFETDAGINFRILPLGFDLTINSDRNSVLDKLTRSCNDTEELPFGFTHIDYFTDGKKPRNCPIIPRYVIGLNRYEIKDILGNGGLETTGRPHTGLLARQNLRARFKILSEIRAQNELFEAMLPEDAYDNPSKNVQIARACIEVADQQLQHALLSCTNKIISYGAVPKEIQEAATRNPHKARTIIEDYLLENGEAEFKRRQQEYSRKFGKDYDPESMDVFVQIMTQVRALKEAAYAGGSPEFPNIEKLRPEQARDRSIVPRVDSPKLRGTKVNI